MKKESKRIIDRRTQLEKDGIPQKKIMLLTPKQLDRIIEKLRKEFLFKD